MIKVQTDKGIDLTVNTFTFPDGEVQVEIQPYNRKYVSHVWITTRITNGNDLFILMQAVDILKRNGTRFSLKILYLMGARMDRVMDFNRPFTLDIVANIINSFGAECVQLVEPHSHESLLRIKNSVVYYSVTTQVAIRQIPDTVLVFPDRGAYERYIESNSDFNAECVICTKERDEATGKIIKFSVENPEVVKKPYKQLYVIDDLCDGGGTFVATAKMLRELNPAAKLTIQVTHMVNPKGITNLSENFDKVIITNSYKDWTDLPNNVEMINLV